MVEGSPFQVIIMSIFDSHPTGKLYIVATPLGNLKDISHRALEVLSQVDAILCEDTRQSLKLLNHYQIKKTLLSFHDHNEAKMCSAILDRLQQGQNLALISDAGTPLISDPGYTLIQVLIQEGINFEAIPGPCALVNALVLSGFSTDQFLFRGFLPPKSAARCRVFSERVDYPMTLIFYESTHRIEKFLKEAYQIFGERRVALVREMTKKFEEIIRGKLIPQGIVPLPRSWKGEFVVLIEGRNALEKRELKNKR